MNTFIEKWMEKFDERFKPRFLDKVLEQDVDFSLLERMFPDLKQFLSDFHEAYKKELVEKIEGMIEEEKKHPPQDDMEKTAEWYKIQALQDIKKLIENER